MTRIGNKTPILPILYALFPKKYNRYIEPFGGSGSVLLGKEKPDSFEVFNDVDGELMNFFRCGRDRSAELLWELGYLPLNSREEFNSWKGIYEPGYFQNPHLSKQIEIIDKSMPPEWAAELKDAMFKRINNFEVRRAAIYYKQTRYSFFSSRRSFSCQPCSITGFFYLFTEMAKRLENVVLENQSYEILIPHYDRKDAFVYGDPPYYDSEYVYNDSFTWEDHVRLRDILAHMKGKFLLSYNDCPEIRELYRGFEIFDFSRLHSMVQKITPGKKFNELLIGNYDLLEREREKPMQITINELLGKPIDIERTLKERIIHAKH